MIFTEQIGIIPGGNVTIAAHETGDGFDNDAFTMSGTANIRSNSASSGYAEASGNANITFNTTAALDFLISDINTAGQTGLQLSFGIFKSGTITVSDQLIVETSSDGINYSPLSYSLPIGAGTATWFYRTAIGTIPATANLRIRFRQGAASPSNQYRIDDIQLTANDSNAGITFSGTNFVCGGSSATLVASQQLSYLWSTGSTNQSITVNAPGAYSCVLTCLNGCTLTSNTLNVNDSTPIQYSVTGGGSYCSSPGTGVAIGLSSSQISYSYQLFHNTTNAIGSPIAGTGSAISFGLNTTAGTYTVIATRNSTVCTQSMLGSAVVSITPATTYYADTDGDGYGNAASTIQSCAPVAGYVINSTDCNDGASGVNPLATEICNGVDDNCNGYIDEGCGTPKYCIGPSASYTPPSGPSYVNQFSPFPTLTAAVAFLNSFSPTQHVIFEFQNNYTGTGETFPIVITYQGNVSATAVFRPRSDVSSILLISGSGFGQTSGLIQFDGADYVSFDGSPGGVSGTTSNLMTRNTFSLNCSANFYFLNDATHNTLNAITIEGGASAYHCILFGGTTGTTGNDFNTVQNCMISNRTDAAVALPSIGIRSESSATGAAANSDISIAGNKIVNIEDGVRIELNGSAGNWSISGNHFYFTNTTARKISEAISVNSIGNLIATISSNYIGGTAPFAGGSPLIETNPNIGTSLVFS
ncbi:MAG: putative metal-binding motif-containing protein [Bacteroidetes bacterium]|nr:putative metal-binding motif-containing protein [Bacteroidota bacterium]